VRRNLAETRSLLLETGLAQLRDRGLGHLTYELEDLPASVGREWALLAVAVEAIVDRLTEPRPA